MKKYLKLIWENKRFVFVFVFSMLVLVFFGLSRNTSDSIWNYGFSYAMATNQVPYRDFTMIVPPFYNFVMSIGLRFFLTDNIFYLIEHSVLITVMFALLWKMYKNKAWIMLAVMCFPIFVAFCPTYNFFLFFLFVVILYLEKNTEKDYLIGMFLSFMCLTKYTVGFFFLIPSFIILFKRKDRLIKRIIGFIIPCFIFLVYLLATNSFMQFLDLCFFGLFDFAKDNTIIFTPMFFLSLLMLIDSIYMVIKNKNNILYWYILFSFSIMLPIFTRFHFYVYVMFFALLFMENIKIKRVDVIKNISLLVCGVTVVFNFFLTGIYKKIERFDGINNFEFYYTIKNSKGNFLEVNDLYNKYKKLGNVIVLSPNTSFLKIVNEDKFTYFTILNDGNYGFNGTKKMINRVKEIEKTYFIICMSEYEAVKKDLTFAYGESQFDVDIVDYVIEHSDKIEYINDYSVYYFNGV